MYLIKKIFKIILVSVFIGILVILSLLIYNHFFSIGGEVSPRVNKDNILSIKTNISEKEVYKILGKPIYFSNEKKDKYLVYGIPGLLDAGAEITLVIRDNKLNHLSIESYDILIYECVLATPCMMFNKNDFNRIIPN